MSNLLNDLQSKHPTDKFNLGYVDTFYQNHFESRQTTTQTVLEVGIYGGDSILLWHDYFPNAKVYGLDIEPRPNRIEFHNPSERLVLMDQVDAYSPQTIETLKQMEPSGFDIVIDDGPHTLDSMIFYVMNYLPLVKKGGIFVLEDIIDLSWTPILCQLADLTLQNFAPHSKRFKYDMRGKQKTQFLYKHWMKGLDVLVVEVM